VRRIRSGEPAALITDAQQSADDEYAHRRKRYAIMMSLRGLCVVGACVLYPFSVWLALGLIVGGAVLPWCAVLIANDRPARKRTKPHQYVAVPLDRGLPTGDDGRTIEG
jgi:hypothetical protein